MSVVCFHLLVFFSGFFFLLLHDIIIIIGLFRHVCFISFPILYFGCFQVVLKFSLLIVVFVISFLSSKLIDLFILFCYCSCDRDDLHPAIYSDIWNDGLLLFVSFCF